MQTLEKLAHSTMPFTTGGQTINDRLTAAKHALAGSQLGKTVCKATTEELMAPKKKHLDYLLHCTNEPNVSIPTMANLLIERTQNPNWVVVYKALITIHNIMCYGNERFSQYLASCNTTFNLTNFVDKTGLIGALAAESLGYDMSTHVRRYGKYISEKIHTYRLCAFDFCKVKRGRDDGLLRTLHTDKLLKTMPILQSQIDALLEFQVNSSELNNGVINCSFILLFRDLIRLFACYNDGVINLLEKFFDMNKKQCREALDLYKAFLSRLDRVQDFLGVAESVGIDRGEIPDLTRAPASLLEALESHLYHLEGGKGPPPTTAAATQQMVHQQIQQQQAEPLFSGATATQIDEAAKERYLQEERERLRQFEEQRRRQLQQGPSSTNPFGQAQPAGGPPAYAGPGPGQPQITQQQHNDLLSFFDTPPKNGGGNGFQIDPTNPFASTLLSGSGEPHQQQQAIPSMFDPNAAANPFLNSSQPSAINPFGAGGYQQQQPMQGLGNYPPPFSYGQQYPMQYQPSQPQQQYQPVQQQQYSAGDYNGMNRQQTLGIYDQTPFSGTDGSYSGSSAMRQNMEYQQQPNPQQFTPHWPVTQQQQQNPPAGNGLGQDVDSALSNLVGNLGISGQQQSGQKPQPQQPSLASMGSQQHQQQPYYPATSQQQQYQQQWTQQQPGGYGGDYGSGNAAYGYGGAYGGMPPTSTPAGYGSGPPPLPSHPPNFAAVAATNNGGGPAI